MSLRAFRRVPFIALLGAMLLAATLLPTASPAAAETVANGGFETGTLEGWTTTSQSGADLWAAYARAQAEGPRVFFPPPAGEGAARGVIPDETVDTTYLYQDIALPAASTDALTMYLYYASGAPFATPTPNTLAVSGAPTAQANQQVRVDVLKPNAPIESLSPNDVLATVYASKPGDPLELPPAVIAADLTPFAGQTVRLRIAEATQGDGIEVGVDDVSVLSDPIPPLPPPPAAIETPLAPSNEFVEGTLIRNRGNGSATLVVSVPGPGTVNVSDARRKVAIGTARSVAKPPPILIRTAAVEASGAGAVRMPIRPTAAAAKRLRRHGRLRFRLQVTFAPTGGRAAIQGFGGTLVRRLRPARR